ncbi:tufB [Symbiodinium natans]|uniref:TufB protein n=1 Tax=Symbiodinium natans TaxID=878477 RepID=A0A812UMH3_9DINO|nr:tufB [Symbiodinium natans]
MAASWLLPAWPVCLWALLAQALADPDDTCLSSIKVIDNFLSDAEAQAVMADLEAQRAPSESERLRQEAPTLAQRLKSELRSKEQEAQLDSAVEVLEPVGKLIVEVLGHPKLEKRLRATITGKEVAQLVASKSSVPVSRKRGDVHEHADHMGGRWVSEKVPGTAAVAYLESAPDGGSLGKLIFKDIGDEKIVKEVEAIAKRFISWDNSKCLHSFKARYDGPRRLLGFNHDRDFSHDRDFNHDEGILQVTHESTVCRALAQTRLPLRSRKGSDQASSRQPWHQHNSCHDVFHKLIVLVKVSASASTTQARGPCHPFAGRCGHRCGESWPRRAKQKRTHDDAVFIAQWGGRCEQCRTSPEPLAPDMRARSKLSHGLKKLVPCGEATLRTMVVGEVASGHVTRWLSEKSQTSRSSTTALRHPATGEAAPVGERYNKEPIPDEEWWLRGNNRSKLLTTAPFTFYDGNPLAKKNFQAQCVGPDHSRRVAQQLGRIGHSFSEANLQVLKEDPHARRYMSQKYAELMQRPQAAGSQPDSEARHKGKGKGSEDRGRKTRLGQLASMSSSMKLPKAELRQTMDGKNVIMLPNPRLPRENASMDIHNPMPPILGRPKFNYTFDYNGERLAM